MHTFGRRGVLLALLILIAVVVCAVIPGPLHDLARDQLFFAILLLLAIPIYIEAGRFIVAKRRKRADKRLNGVDEEHDSPFARWEEYRKSARAKRLRLFGTLSCTLVCSAPFFSLLGEETLAIVVFGLGLVCCALSIAVNRREKRRLEEKGLGSALVQRAVREHYGLNEPLPPSPPWVRRLNVIAFVVFGLALCAFVFIVNRLDLFSPTPRWTRIESASAWVDRTGHTRPTLGALWTVKATPPLDEPAEFWLELWSSPTQKVAIVAVQFKGDSDGGNSLYRSASAGAILDSRTRHTRSLPRQTYAKLRGRTVELTMPLSVLRQPICCWRALALDVDVKGEEYPNAKTSPLKLGTSRPRATTLPAGSRPSYMNLGGVSVRRRQHDFLIALPDAKLPPEHTLLRSVTLFDRPVRNSVSIAVETGDRERTFLDNNGPKTTPLELRHVGKRIEILVPFAKLPAGLRYWYATSSDSLEGYFFEGSFFDPRPITSG